MFQTMILSCLSLLFLILHADLAAKGAATGLLLWYSAVVPSLFPFMVLSSMLSASGSLSRLLFPLTSLFRFLRISTDGWYVLLTGLLCGCPMGAKTCADFLCEGRIDSEEACFLFALCNHPSPMFLAGFVYPMFAAQLPLSYFLCSVYGTLLLLSIPAGRIYLPKKGIAAGSTEKKSERTKGSSNPSASTSPELFDEAILMSAEILIKIGGYLIFYSILILTIQSTVLLPDPIRLFLCAILEITTGIRTVQSRLPFPFSAIAATAVFSFGGFSALSQTHAVIKKAAGLSIRQYLLWKIAHALFSAAAMTALTGAFPILFRRLYSLFPALQLPLSR